MKIITKLVVVKDPPPDLHPETAPHYVEVCCTSSKSFGSPPICNITLFPTNPAQPRSWLWGSGVCSLLGSSCRNHTSSSRWGTPCLSILPFPQSFEVHNQHTNLDRMWSCFHPPHLFPHACPSHLQVGDSSEKVPTQVEHLNKMTLESSMKQQFFFCTTPKIHTTHNQESCNISRDLLQLAPSRQSQSQLRQAPTT